MAKTKSEVRQQVIDELTSRGYKNAHSISNKLACVLLGLVPGDVKGIGGVRGGKILKCWAEGTPIPSLEQLGVFRAENVVSFRPVIREKISANLASLRTKKRPEEPARKDFYYTDEWRAVRYEALRINGGKCQCCGRGRAHGVVLHVDHIKPRSKFPHLELDLSNLQVLCEDCNLGKSNKDATDWRIA